MADLVTFTRDQARRLLRMLTRFEADERSEGAVSSQRRPADPVQILKITGSVSGGLYPAKLWWWNDATATETLSDEVRWKPRNGAAPAVDDYVFGRYTGPTAAGTHGLYVGAGAGGSIPTSSAWFPVPYRFAADPEDPCSFVPTAFKYVVISTDPVDGITIDVSDTEPE